MEEYEIVREENPGDSAWGIIGQGINEFNTQHAGEEKSKRLCFVVQNSAREVVGGVIALVYWNWLYIDLMWLKDGLRRRGFGHRLLEQVEQEARHHGARHVHLDTFSFQALDFYKKYGYRVFGELADCPAGHTRYYLTKDL